MQRCRELTARGKNISRPDSAWPAPETASGFRGRRSPHPVAAGLVRCLRNRPRNLHWLASIGVLTLLADCQRIEEVSGTLLVDGRPQGGIMVMFDPEGRDGPRGVATTDKDGAYALRRLGPGGKSGLPTGKYSVKLMVDVDNPSAPKIPPRYFRGTELSYDVVGGNDNVFDIDVSTK